MQWIIILLIAIICYLFQVMMTFGHLPKNTFVLITQDKFKWQSQNPICFLLLKTPLLYFEIIGIADVTGNFPNSAILGEDFTLPTQTTIEFEPNQRSQTVEIDILLENPAVYEGKEEFTLMLEPSSIELQDQIGDLNKATIVITDQRK